MDLVLQTAPLPLSTDEDGIVRVGGTRVTLDVIVEAFLEGATAEEIAQQYPSVALADVYSVVGYYLRNRAEIERYLSERAARHGEVRRDNETAADPAGIRDRLLARRRGD